VTSATGRRVPGRARGVQSGPSGADAGAMDALAVVIAPAVAALVSLAGLLWTLARTGGPVALTVTAPRPLRRRPR
jgi:hypothetical protein